MPGTETSSVKEEPDKYFGFLAKLGKFFSRVIQMRKTGVVWLTCAASHRQGINLWRSYVVLSSR